MRLSLSVKIRIIISYLFLCIAICVYSQNTHQDFKEELERLNYIRGTKGASSLLFANQLAYMSVAFCDTTFHNHYSQLSKLIVANHLSVRDNYGIDSEEYRAVLIYLHHSYVYGKFYDSVNLDYKPQVRDCILSLEKDIKNVHSNKHEFYSLISNIHFEDKEYKDVIRLRKKAIEEIGKKNSVDEYFYDLENLAAAYYFSGQIKSFKETSKLLFDSREISKEMKQMGFLFLSQTILKTNNKWNDESIKYLFDIYIGEGTFSLSQNGLLYDIAAKKGDVAFLKQFESIVLSSGNATLQELFDFYFYVSMFLSQEAKDQKASIEYGVKAMNTMEKIGTCEARFSKIGTPYYETMALRYRDDNNYSKVIECEIKALEDVENCFGANNEKYYSLARTIGSDYSNYFADLNNSLFYMRKALNSARMIYGASSCESLDIALNIIHDLQSINHFKEAELLCDSCLTIVNANPQSKDYLPKIYNQKAMVAKGQMKTKEAFACYNKAIETATSNNDKIVYLLNRGDLMKDVGIETESDILMIDSLITNNKEVSNRVRFDFYYHAAIFYSESDKLLSKHFYDKADLYIGDLLPHRKVTFRLSQSLTEPNQAKRYSLLTDAIDIFDNCNLKDSMLLAEVYKYVADYFSDHSNYEDAFRYYDKSINIYKSIDADINDPGLLACMNNYASLLSYIDEANVMATSILKMVYDVRKKTLLPFSPVLRTSLINLIEAYLRGKHIKEAESLLDEDCLLLAEGDMHLLLYEYDLLKAKIFYAKGNAPEAIRILKINEDFVKENNEYVISYYETLMNYEQSLGHDIYDYWCKLIELYKKDTFKNLLYYSTNERKSMLFEFQYVMNRLLIDGEKDSRYHPMIADYSLFSKGLLLTTNHLVQKILRKDKIAQQLYVEGKNKRIKRTGLVPKDSIRIKKLDREIALIDKKISDRVEIDKFIRQLSFSPSDLHKILGKNKVAIDFIMSESDSLNYYYAEVYKNNETKLIPLFSKSEIARYEALGESGINAMAKPMFGKLIWAKLIPFVSNCKDVFFSPVGSLNKFAIELLPILNDSVADVAFHRVLKFEKEMVDRIGKKVSTNEVAAFGDVDYDTFVNDVSDRGIQDRKWGQLKATVEELQDIQEAYSKSHLGFYEKTNASERNFKNLDENEVNLLHLATHGFYISDKAIKLASESVNNKYYVSQVSACGGQGRGGILLSGANYSWYHEVPDGVEDGILTTEEIEDLTFKNLDLVVLSACETGLGESNTDGVWGLQRAFRIAGAKRQIVSLLKVDDERTKEFMGELHRNISESHDVYASFKKAQRYMYNKYKQYPRFWASFILLE